VQRQDYAQPSVLLGAASYFCLFLKGYIAGRGAEFCLRDKKSLFFFHFLPFFPILSRMPAFLCSTKTREIDKNR